MKTRILFISIFILIILAACQVATKITPTYNKGGYSLETLKSKHKKNAIIFGQVKDIESRLPIKIANVTLGCLTITVDQEGYYQFIGERTPIENVFLTCSTIGYRSIETEHFKLMEADSLRIDFYLIQDDRPLINCEGQIGK